jgi:hypothetical protein
LRTYFISSISSISIKIESYYFTLIEYFYIFRDDRDRSDEIQQLIARAELNARQYMTNFNLTSLTTPSAVVRIVPLSSPTKSS